MKTTLLALILSFSAIVNAEPCSEAEQKKTDALVEEYPLDDWVSLNKRSQSSTRF